MNVAIIGGGIGGLVTALQLHRIGIRATVYESAADIQPLGVGINLLPHATRILDECGLLDELSATAIDTKDLIFFNKFGQKIWQEPRGLEAGYAWPQLSIQRGELQMILLQAVRERLGSDAVRLSHHLVDFEQGSESKALARFIDRKTGETVAVERADLMIAADGIHSTVRAKFYPHELEPIWNGILFWRAVSVIPPILSGRSMISVGYPGHRFIAYPISQAHAVRGVSLLNWIVEIKRNPNEPFRRESWNWRGHLDEFMPRFEGWRFDWLDVPAIMRASEVIYEYPCVDRDPLDQWTFGRVTLLGDAAHPMYPMGSNGASQAILDASALANALVAARDIPEALAVYENVRRPKVAAIVLRNRKQGPGEIQSIVEERSPNGFGNIEDVMSKEELAGFAEEYKRVAGFDRESVNAGRKP